MKAHFYFLHSHTAVNVTYNVGELAPSSCVGSSESTATVCLNQEVTFTCTSSGARLRWRTSATGNSAVVFERSSTPGENSASTLNDNEGTISFVARLESIDGGVFTSTLSATVDSSAYNLNTTCDDLAGTLVTLPLEVVSGKRFCYTKQYYVGMYCNIHVYTITHIYICLFLGLLSVATSSMVKL